MLLMLQANVVENAERILSITDVTIAGILLAVIVVLLFEVRYYKKLIKEKDTEIMKILSSKIDLLKENKNDVEQIKQYFIQMAEQIKSVLSSRKTG